MTIISTINILRNAGRPEYESIVKQNEDDATRREIEGMKRGNRRGR